MRMCFITHSFDRRPSFTPPYPHPVSSHVVQRSSFTPPYPHPTTTTIKKKQAPAALLRLPLHLARLGHPPADLLALGFWPQYLQAASTAAAAAAAWSRLRIDELMAWPAALASLGPDADDESYSSSIDALAAAWLDAALARHHGDGGTPSALSLLQWAGGLEGLSRLHSSAPLSLDPFGPRVGAVLRGLLSGGAADEEDGGGAADAVPQLWAALIWLGWLEGDEEGEQGVIQLLAQAAERGIARYGRVRYMWVMGD